MRKYAYMLLAAAFTVFASCENREVEAPVETPVLTVSNSQAYFPADGGTGTIVVSASGTVSASSNKEWLTASVSGNTVTLTAERNKSIQSRYAIVTIKEGEATAQVTAQQLGYQTASITLEDIFSDSNTHTYLYPYTYAGTISLTSNVSWLTATAVEDASGKAIEVIIEENREGKTRHGQILWQLGMEDGVIEVTQYLSLSVDNGWSLAYLRDEGLNSIFEVGGTSGPYVVGILSKSSFASQYGSSYEQFALDTVSDPGQVYDSNGEISWELLSSGTYAAVVVGVDESGEPTGSYNYFELEVSKQNEKSKYEMWLGTWKSVGSDGTTMEFKITQDVKEESYYISGFSDYIDPVSAGYDPATGNLLLKFYESDKMLGTSYYLYIAGVGDNGYVAYGDAETETLGVVSLSSETTAVAKGHSYDYTFSDGETTHYNVLWMGMFGYGVRSDGSTGWVNFNDIDYIYFPANWTKTEDGGTGGGGGGGGDDKSGYESFLGTWTWDGYSFEITQDKVNSTYVVDGYGMEVDARYNNGKLELFGQDLGTDGEYEYYFWGLDNDGDGYLVEGDSKNGNLLATASVSGGTMKIEGHEFDAVYGGTTYHEVIVKLGIYAEDLASGNLYSFNNVPYMDLPATLTKSSKAPRVNLEKVSQTVSKAETTTRNYEVKMPKGVKTAMRRR